MEAWPWPSSNYRLSYWQGIQNFMANVNPECKLLTAYVGHFYMATCDSLDTSSEGKDQLTRQPITSSPTIVIVFS